MYNTKSFFLNSVGTGQIAVNFSIGANHRNHFKAGKMSDQDPSQFLHKLSVIVMSKVVLPAHDARGPEKTEVPARE